MSIPAGSGAEIKLSGLCYLLYRKCDIKGWRQWEKMDACKKSIYIHPAAPEKSNYLSVFQKRRSMMDFPASGRCGMVALSPLFSCGT
jgi:hypothetical protein